jgi:hypothetical protein
VRLLIALAQLNPGVLLKNSRCGVFHVRFEKVCEFSDGGT